MLNADDTDDNVTQCGDLHYKSIDGQCKKILSSQSSIDSTSQHLDAYNEKDGSLSTCTVLGRLHCNENTPNCFQVFDICFYRLGQNYDVQPCNQGEHLVNCKLFPCNAKFKCPQLYCIPWSYVGDGKWDCPAGADEMFFSKRSKPICTGMYICEKTRKRCVHTLSICDAKADCPSGDDEVLCDLKHVQCPSKCHCLAHALLCQSGPSILNAHPLPFSFVSISNYSDATATAFQTSFFETKILHLKRNKLSEFCVSGKFWSVLSALDLKSNVITKVNMFCFQDSANLISVILDKNNISLLQSCAFNNLSKLVSLSLSYNPLTVVSKNFTHTCPSLKLLLLNDTQVLQLEPGEFKGMKLQAVITNKYQVCCLAPAETVCSAKRPHVLCGNLLPSTELKVIFIAISGLIFCLNISSILLHIKTKNNQDSKKSHIVMVISINVTEKLCAVYLSIVWVADVHLAGQFQLQDEIWMSGAACFSGFAFSLFYELLTQCLLILLAVVRLRIVMKPITTNFKKTLFVLKWIGFVSTPPFLVVTALLFVAVLVDAKVPSALCFPLLDPTKLALAIKLCVPLVFVSQAMAAVAIIVLYTTMAQKFLKSQQHITKSKSKEDGSVSLFVQLVVTCTSCVFCWFSLNIICVTAMFLSEYPSQLVVWAVAMAMPFNSVMNPVVFVFTCARKALRRSERIFR